jgi:UPF0042 nucleotide-binding protein
VSAQPPGAPPLRVVIVTGTSGSGKSVALHALEDAGYFCVDNLPPELLRAFLQLERERGADRRIAIAVDVRSAGSLPHLLPQMQALRAEGVDVQSVFLDASTDALVRRFSESRRPHPLSELPSEAGPGGRRALVDAIDLERELLADLRERSTVLDTSQIRAAQLRTWMREFVRATGSRLAVVFESFAFKHGVPLDADTVFDVRVLPNPHYVPALQPLTGRDPAVAAFLEGKPEVLEMLAHVEGFLARWLPAYESDQRSSLTVAIGCTGGQHRSVWFVERLAERFAPRVATLVRHRELAIEAAEAEARP